MPFKSKPHSSAFTLIELLVVIAIIGLLATISVVALNNARAKARDTKRVADIKQISTALEMYYNDTGHYPTSQEFNSGSLSSTSTDNGPNITYMASIPIAPTPADNTCSNTNQYIYTPSPDDSSYTLSFCLGGQVSQLTSGNKCATPGGMMNVDCSGGGGITFQINPCPGTPVVQYDGGPYDGNGLTTTTGGYYRTIQIGSQCWLRDNLNVGTFIDSHISTSSCLDVSGHNWHWWSCQSGGAKYCYGYNGQAGGNPDNCITSGGLYEWAEALGLPRDCNYAPSTDNGDGTYTLDCPTSGTHTILAKQQGICPPDWHIPSDSDWHALELVYANPADDTNCDIDHNYGDCSPASHYLKQRANIMNYYNNPNGLGCRSDQGDTDDVNCGASGFNILLAGYRYSSGNFEGQGGYGLFWSSTPYSGIPYFAWDRYLYSGDSKIYRGGNFRVAGWSIRCVKDE